MEEKYTNDALDFYQRFRWVQVGLWRIQKFQPPQMAEDIKTCKDKEQIALLEEFWNDRMDKPLPAREVHYILAIMTQWHASNEYVEFEDPRLRFYMLFEMMSSRKRMLVDALLRAPRILGIDPLTKKDVDYDVEMAHMWVEAAKKMSA
jgi:hypothetical protein